MAPLFPSAPASALASASLFGRPSTANCTVHWREVPLDHFNFQEPRTFRQRYFTYDGFCASSHSPILLYTGNEASVELYVNSTGWMWERGARLGALLVFAEHRYYGESLPFGGDAGAYDAAALRWLSLEQALADYATLAHHLRASRAAAPLVAVGGSYGGMLAAWLRMHYPSAAVGALAASAPVLAFDGLLGQPHFDGNEYWRVVTRDASPAAGAAAGCTRGVRAAWPRLFRLAREAAGRARLRDAFRLCAPMRAADGELLAAALLNVWDTLAMGNYPYASNYLVFQQTRDPAVELPAWPMRVACAFFEGMSDETPEDELLHAMASAAGVLYNASGTLPCMKLPSDPNFDGIWDYQWCSERLPQETYFPLDGIHDMFWTRPANKSAINERCAAKYGVRRDSMWIAATSSFMEGAQGASNVIFSNGEYDPWRAGGVLTNLSDSIVALQVPRGAHHLDLMFSHPLDPPEVRAVRDAEEAIVRGWISKHSDAAREQGLVT
ncbi:hypothetical protein AB1Y20_019529 [Prymnesium parvum]|uniref:Lysosomal Pro-X carboxypeptidase n=1 Tax=Prymnesium parvum TaxID=97485 RepID=A0AB34JUV4_PRYPA